MNKDYGEIICSAVDSIIQSRLSNLEFNITKTCTIIDISSRNQGKYIVSDGSAKFEVYSEDTSYNLDDNVLVLIPNGDYKNNKIILGKTKIEKELPYKYTSPMTTMVKFTDNILYDGNYEEKTFNSNAMSLLANENEEES